MDNHTKDLVTIVLQHLHDNEFHEAAHTLEKESGVFFNVDYLEEKVIAGEWDELEKYLLGFTKLDDNRFSLKTFFEIRKQKYLEAFDRNEKDNAVAILKEDLKVFSSYDEAMYKEMSSLLILENITEHENLRYHVDAEQSRTLLVIILKKLVEENPIVCQKLEFPSFGPERLITMLNQSLNMQHALCENRREIPEIESLLTDHECRPLNETEASTPVDVIPIDTAANCDAAPSLEVDNTGMQADMQTDMQTDIQADMGREEA